MHFDQRASGKSAKQPDLYKEPTIQQYVDDLVEMSVRLAKQFGHEKIWLVCHSWGTLIGLRAAFSHPELFHAYIGLGQITNMIKAEKITYNYAMQKALEKGDSHVIEKLNELDQPPWVESWKVSEHRKCLRKMGGAVYDEKIRIQLIWQAMCSPEYSLGELYRSCQASGKLWPKMWDEMMEVDFFKEIDTMKIPVHILAGKYDWQVPSTLAENFYDLLIAPQGKHFYLFEKSGHLPHYEEPEKFRQVIIDLLKMSD